MIDNYTLYHRLWETLRFHIFTSCNKQVEIDDTNRDYLLDKIMTDIRKHIDSTLG